MFPKLPVTLMSLCCHLLSNLNVTMMLHQCHLFTNLIMTLHHVTCAPKNLSPWCFNATPVPQFTWMLHWCLTVKEACKVYWDMCQIFYIIRLKLQVSPSTIKNRWVLPYGIVTYPRIQCTPVEFCWDLSLYNL